MHMGDDTMTEGSTTGAAGAMGGVLATPLTRRSLVTRGALLGALAVVGMGVGSGVGASLTRRALASEAAPAGAGDADAPVQDTLPLAVVNFQPTWGDVSANVDAMIDVARDAAQQGARLILFPEMSVTGYVYSTDETDADSRMAVESAETVDGPTAARFSELAQELDAWIVYGATETVPDDDAHAYNSAFACAPDGTVSTYQKIHPVEGAWCMPGSTPMILQTAWGKVGVDICYDTYAIPELERYYAAQGCRLLLNPTATSRGFDAEAGDATLWRWYFETRIRNIAIRDQIFVASANLADYDGSHFTFPGGSSVFGPTGSDGSTSFATCYVGDTAEQHAAAFAGEIDLSLATATDILHSDNYRPDLFASWYEELADAADARAAASAEADDGQTGGAASSAADATTGSSAASSADDSAAASAGMNSSAADSAAADAGASTLVVSAVNFQPTFGDKEANCASMEAYVEQAAQAGAALVVFPEMALTGYAYADEEGAANGQAAVDAAEPTDGPYAARISDLAVAHDMCVIFGTAEPVGDGAHAYNAAYVCAPDGSVQSYRKIAPVEGPWCVAGQDPLVVDTPFGSLGLSICKDTYAYPELARYYMACGCAFVVNLTARTGVADGWADLYENALENLADQDKVIVVSADLCGADLDAPAEQAGWEPYTGASVITAPLAKGADGSYVRTWGSYASDPSATGLVTAEIDLGELSLGHGEAIQSFNPRLYAALYEGETFQNTSADLSAAVAAA